MENVNNLNGVPNFGHGLPEENEKVSNESAQSDEGVQAGVAPLGEQEGTKSEVTEAGSGNSDEGEWIE